MNQLVSGLVEGYLSAKANLSKWNDEVMKDAPRLEVPSFATPRDAADYYFRQMGNPYTGDPLNGAVDHYLHPQRLQAGLADGSWKSLHIDCDDVAGWYKHAVRLCCSTAEVVTLVDLRATLRNGSHVVLLGEHEGRPFALDTNGYRELPDLSEETAIRTWEAIYANQGFKYVGYVEDPYPFNPS